MCAQGFFKFWTGFVLRAAFATGLLTLAVAASTSGAAAESMGPVGARGDHQTPDHCLGPNYLVGFVVRSGDWLNQIAIICSPVDGNGRTGAPAFGPLRGGNGGSPPHNVTCQVNEVAVGLLVHLTSDNRRVRGIGLDCKNAQNVQSQGLGRIVNLGLTDTPAISELCKPGEAIVRVDVNWGNDVNGVGVTCEQGPRLGAASASAGPGAGATPGACTPKADPVPPEWADMLNQHNARRKQHCAPALAWSSCLASGAQVYASKCILNQHGASNENMADAVRVNINGSNVSPVLPAEGNIDAYENTWYCEKANYNFQNPVFLGGFTQNCGQGNNPKVNGHFTQVVWKDARLVGCGKQTCSMGPMDIKDSNGNVIQHNVTTQGTHWVCRYDTGNAPTDSATLSREISDAVCK